MIGLKSSSQPIKCSYKLNSNLVTRVFLRFEQVPCFYFEFSFVNDDVNFVLIGFFDYFGFGFSTPITIDDRDYGQVFLWSTKCMKHFQ